MKLRKSSCTFFAAAALALAGCGDSGSTTKTDPIPDLLLTIGEQERKASGAKDSADMSLKDATTKASMLSAVKVMGESSDAEANAKAILAAEGKVDSALMEANAALTALQQAKTEADALPADTPKLAELKAELAMAIKEATAHRDAIQAIKNATGTGSLKKLMEKVTGANGKGTSADIAAAVAVEVEKAMVFRNGFTTTHPPITGGEPQTTTTGYTSVSLFENSFGNDKLDEEFRKTTVYDLPGVELRSNDYATYGYWLGIPKGGDTILGIYVFGAPKIEQEAPDDAFQAPGGTQKFESKTATYSGKALGFSVLTTKGKNPEAIKSGEFTADVKLTATFAGVDDSTVKGTVNNFEGNAVGAEWSVDLKTAPLLKGESGGFDDDNWGLNRGSGSRTNGAWHARAAKGPATQRPNSISGTFQTFFSDGRAMGGFATIKDE